MTRCLPGITRSRSVDRLALRFYLDGFDTSTEHPHPEADIEKAAQFRAIGGPQIWKGRIWGGLVRAYLQICLTGQDLAQLPVITPPS